VLEGPNTPRPDQHADARGDDIDVSRAWRDTQPVQTRDDAVRYLVEKGA
jgi:hypothetical protein